MKRNLITVLTVAVNKRNKYRKMKIRMILALTLSKQENKREMKLNLMI
jgi:hypothetical protein